MTNEIKDNTPKTRNNDDAKIYVRFNKDILEQVDEMAKVYGMSRSSLIAFYVGKMVEQDKLQRQAIKEAMKPENMALLMKQLDIDFDNLQANKMR